MKVINEEQFNTLLNAEKRLIVIDFFATWCGPCRMLAPVLEDVANEIGEEVVFAKVDVDESFDLARKYGVMSVPTLVFIKQGNLQNKMTGYRDREELIDEIRGNI